MVNNEIFFFFFSFSPEIARLVLEGSIHQMFSYIWM